MRRFLLAAALLSGLSAAFAGTVYSVNVDTAAIPSGTDGLLYFSFNRSPFGAFDAWATIQAFSPADGSATEPGAANGDVAGSLVPGPLRIGNTTPLNDYLVPFRFSGTPIRFLLLFSGWPGDAESGSSFGFAMSDAAGTPLATTDEFGYAFLIELNADGTTTPTLFPMMENGPSAVTLAVSPEPATGLLLAGALGLLWRLRRRR